jgi:hypothetical protein
MGPALRFPGALVETGDQGSIPVRASGSGERTRGLDLMYTKLCAALGGLRVSAENFKTQKTQRTAAADAKFRFWDLGYLRSSQLDMSARRSLSPDHGTECMRTSSSSLFHRVLSSSSSLF